MRDPVFLLPHQCSLGSVFPVLTICAGVKWYLVVVLVCVFLTTQSVEHLLMLIGHSYIFEYLFESFPHLKRLGCWTFKCRFVRVVYMVLIQVFRQIHMLRMFFHLWFFNLLMASFGITNVMFWWRSVLSVYFLLRLCPVQVCENILFMIVPRSFRIIFKYMTKIILVCGVRKRLSLFV